MLVTRAVLESGDDEKTFTHFEEKPSFQEVDELATRYIQLYIVEDRPRVLECVSVGVGRSAKEEFMLEIVGEGLHAGRYFGDEEVHERVEKFDRVECRRVDSDGGETA